MSERACRECRLISQRTNSCPNCRSTNLSEDFSGLVIIIDPNGSTIAELMKVNKNGRYAIRVR